MSVNGCGPEWMDKWGWSRKLQDGLFDWFHEASCDKHDEGYAEGGGRKRRKVCDEKFLDAMLRDSDVLRGTKRSIAMSQAYAFYGLVRAFGWLHFNYWGH